MPKNFSLEYNRVIWNAKERKGLQGKRSMWGRGIEAIQKQKTQQNKERAYTICAQQVG